MSSDTCVMRKRPHQRAIHDSAIDRSPRHAKNEMCMGHHDDAELLHAPVCRREAQRTVSW